MNYPNEFNTWFDKVVAKWEGGIANRDLSADPGGYTNHGVTEATWKNGGAKVLGKPATRDALSKITFEDAKKIAYSLYWLAHKIDTVKNPLLRIHLAEGYWGGGGLSPLGYIGTVAGKRQYKYKTIADLNKDNPSIDEIGQRRYNWYTTLANFTQNPGWINRLNTAMEVTGGKKFSILKAGVQAVKGKIKNNPVSSTLIFILLLLIFAYAIMQNKK